MRIGIQFHTSDEALSGVECYGLNLIRALVTLAPEHDYVVFSNRPETVVGHAGEAPNLTVQKVRHGRTRACRILWEHLRLPALAEKHGVALLHCPSYICPVTGSRVPCIITVHDTIALDHPEWCKRSNAVYYRLFMGRAVSQAAAIVAVSEKTAQDLTRHFPSCVSRIEIIPPGLDPVFEDTPTADVLDVVRKRYALPKKYILHAGNLEPKKGLTALLEGYRVFLQKGHTHALVLTGGRQWRSRTLVQRLQAELTGACQLTGYIARQDLPAVYRMASAFVFPSLYEGFGFPPLEAMRCGVPVIASSGGALTETLGEAAIRIDPLRPATIANALDQLIRSNELRSEYIRRGREQAKKYNWETAAKSLVSLYCRIAA
jgi:glycosyltransferase involved in cell wall biosynthesis